MSVILISERPLDFVREVVVHLQHHIQLLKVIFLSAPAVENEREQDHVELPQIKAALRGEVGVEDNAGEAEAAESPRVLRIVKELQLLLVLEIAIVEPCVLLVPLDIFLHHLH